MRLRQLSLGRDSLRTQANSCCLLLSKWYTARPPEETMRTTSIAAATLLMCGMATAQVQFSSSFYETPGPASGVISGDFNRDGRPDLAVGNGQSDPSTVSVFL